MLLNQELLDTLTAQAQASSRLRQNYDLRNSENDHSQRMLNALVTGRYLIEAGGENPGIVVPMGQWHSLECLESRTVILECKDDACQPLTEEEILKL